MTPLTPARASYDVVIVGGALLGTSVAWWLTQMPGFQGRILVVEKDPTYAQAATSLTNSCIRQQFSNPTNIRISQFGARFIKEFRHRMGDDPDVPDLRLQSFGYMYLADTPAFAETLRDSQRLQAELGAGTRHMTCDQIAAAYPFYRLDDILAANHNTLDEGYFDGGTLFDVMRRKARQNGADYITDEVTGLTRTQGRITHVTLGQAGRIGCGTVVNATGTRGAHMARKAGLEIPVEPRKRYSFVFDAAEPLDRDLPLTIDPSGVHMRSEGGYYLAGCPPDDDPAVDPDDFIADHSLWEQKVWPILAGRIPQFESVKLMNTWVGHYDYNTLDQNAILGPHPEVENFILCNGFSGHGLQQAPAIGRGLAEHIAYGAYRSLDLTPLGMERVLRGAAFLEKAVI